MNYLFKLARRTVRFRAWPLCLAIVAACSMDNATPPPQSSSTTRSQSTIAVASVIVSPASASGTIGQSAQFTATANGSTGAPLSGQSVVWTSTDSTIVQITSSGMATAIGVGTVRLVATVNGVGGSASATVTGTPAASIAVSPSQAGAGTVGQSAQFSATLKEREREMCSRGGVQDPGRAAPHRW